MPSPLPYLALTAALALASCQQSPKTDNVLQGPVEIAQPADKPAPPAGMKIETEARALTAAYVKTLPNAALYVVDSARVNENGPTWQVLVPRRDWAKRMPNSARFEVNKTTGEVNTGTVK